MAGSTDSNNSKVEVKVIRWRGNQHPTQHAIVTKMQAEGLRPYSWSHGPNFRYAVQTHGYDKVMYCVEGSVEISLPDYNQRVVLRPGDRMDVPRGVRHSTVIGPNGAQCFESSKN
jgi:mannose-6-phosphate isomerase-like protein (cupin superfamily)